MAIRADSVPLWAADVVVGGTYFRDVQIAPRGGGRRGDLLMAGAGLGGRAPPTGDLFVLAAIGDDMMPLQVSDDCAGLDEVDVGDVPPAENPMPSTIVVGTNLDANLNVVHSRVGPAWIDLCGFAGYIAPFLPCADLDGDGLTVEVEKTYLSCDSLEQFPGGINAAPEWAQLNCFRTAAILAGRGLAWHGSDTDNDGLLDNEEIHCRRRCYAHEPVEPYFWTGPCLTDGTGACTSDCPSGTAFVSELVPAQVGQARPGSYSTFVWLADVTSELAPLYDARATDTVLDYLQTVFSAELFQCPDAPDETSCSAAERFDVDFNILYGYAESTAVVPHLETKARWGESQLSGLLNLRYTRDFPANLKHSGFVRFALLTQKLDVRVGAEPWGTVNYGGITYFDHLVAFRGMDDGLAPDQAADAKRAALLAHELGHSLGFDDYQSMPANNGLPGVYISHYGNPASTAFTGIFEWPSVTNIDSGYHLASKEAAFDVSLLGSPCTLDQECNPAASGLRCLQVAADEPGARRCIVDCGQPYAGLGVWFPDRSGVHGRLSRQDEGILIDEAGVPECRDEPPAGSLASVSFWRNVFCGYADPGTGLLVSQNDWQLALALATYRLRGSYNHDGLTQEQLSAIDFWAADVTPLLLSCSGPSCTVDLDGNGSDTCAPGTSGPFDFHTPAVDPQRYYGENDAYQFIAAAKGALDFGTGLSAPTGAYMQSDLEHLVLWLPFGDGEVRNHFGGALFPVGSPSAFKVTESTPRPDRWAARLLAGDSIDLKPYDAQAQAAYAELWSISVKTSPVPRWGGTLAANVRFLPSPAIGTHRILTSEQFTVDLVVDSTLAAELRVCILDASVGGGTCTYGIPAEISSYGPQFPAAFDYNDVFVRCAAREQGGGLCRVLVKSSETHCQQLLVAEPLLSGTETVVLGAADGFDSFEGDIDDLLITSRPQVLLPAAVPFDCDLSP